MKTFVWKKIEHRTHGDIGHSLSILEELENDNVQFWGSVSLYPTPEWKYQFVAFNKDRVLMGTKEVADDIEEAQDAIESFLMQEGVISEGDEVDYE